MNLEERGVGLILLEKTLLILTDFVDSNKFLKHVGEKKVIRKASVRRMRLNVAGSIEFSLIFVPQGSTKLRGYFIFLPLKKSRGYSIFYKLCRFSFLFLFLKNKKKIFIIYKLFLNLKF